MSEEGIFNNEVFQAFLPVAVIVGVCCESVPAALLVFSILVVGDILRLLVRKEAFNNEVFQTFLPMAVIVGVWRESVPAALLTFSVLLVGDISRLLVAGNRRKRVGDKDGIVRDDRLHG